MSMVNIDGSRQYIYNIIGLHLTLTLKLLCDKQAALTTTLVIYTSWNMEYVL